ASILAVGDDVELRKQAGKRTHGGRFRGSLLAADEHTADGGVDGVEHERLLHAVLPDDGGEREDGAAGLHRKHSLRCSHAEPVSTAAQRLLDALDDRSLRQVVEPQVLAAGALSEVEPGVEAVTAEQRRAIAA